MTYSCDNCGRTSCKLWREYQTVADQTSLFCAHCALRHQAINIEDDLPAHVDAAGERITWIGEASSEHGPVPYIERTNQIGWLVPAVPTEEGDTFWGYTSVPCDRHLWWLGLPT